MEALLSGAAGGLVVGAVLLFVEYYLIHRLEKRRDAAEQRTVKFSNEERRITGSIFNHLGPRSSIELMKGDLGPPNKKIIEREGSFVEDSNVKETNSYIYFFKNAQVKITSMDDATIDSLTVMAEGSDIIFSHLFFVDPNEKDKFLNQAKLTVEMLEGCETDQFWGCQDCFASACKEIGNPFHVYLTYFLDSPKEDITQNPNLLIGSVIKGLCISSYREAPGYIFIEMAG